MPRDRAGRAVVRALAAGLALTGCGGGNGGSGGGGGGASGGTRAVLAAVEAKSSSLKKSAATAAEFNTKLAAYLAAQPAFEAAGVDADTSSVWARFKNGRLLIVANNRPPGAVTDRGESLTHVAARAEGIPLPTQARLLHSFGPNFDLVQQPLDDIGTWLSDNGYVLAGGKSGDSRVTILQKVTGDGFFYFNTHGGKGKSRSGGDMFAMQSSTLVSDVVDNFADFKDDLDNNRLVYMEAANGLVNGTTGETLFDTRYAVTAGFVDKYWKFGKNSVLFFNVCYSAFTGTGDPFSKNPLTQGAGPFIDACRKKGAGVYLGWTQPVTPNGAFKGVRYFVDRMIGAKKYKPEDPNQRPFAVGDVMKDMARVHLDTDGGSLLVAIPSFNADSPAILAPSISFMGVDETRKVLTINGIFGMEPGKVTVGGAELGILSWKPHAIECNIDPGVAGDTIVEVRGHKSNVVQLTEWVAKFRTEFDEGQGSLKQTGFLEVHFRADIHSHRDVPHETPIKPIVPFGEEASSNGKFTASGVFVETNQTTTWSGSVILHPLQAHDPVNLLTCQGNIDVKQKKIDFELLGASVSGMTTTTVGGGITTKDTLPGTSGHMDAGPDEAPVLHLLLNDDFSINGGIREERVGPLHFRTDWDKITPRYPPDKLAARSIAANLR